MTHAKKRNMRIARKTMQHLLLKMRATNNRRKRLHRPKHKYKSCKYWFFMDMERQVDRYLTATAKLRAKMREQMGGGFKK